MESAEGIHRRERFVTNEDTRRGGEGARDLEATALAAGEARSLGVEEGFEAKVTRDGESVGRAGRARAAGEALEDGEVIANGEVGEDARSLRDVAEAAASTFEEGEARDVVAGEEDDSFDGGELADEDTEEGGLASTAGAKDGEDFAGTRFEGDAVKEGAAGEADGEGGGEEGHVGK
nr:hypothetical protein [Polyangium spumosum]